MDFIFFIRNETDISETEASLVTEEVTRILIKIHLKIITTLLIRNTLNSYLLEIGLENIQRQYSSIEIPKYDIKMLKDKFRKKKLIIKKIGKWTLWEYDAVEAMTDKK